MTKTSGKTRRICGNCRYHNAYGYPDSVFCFARFTERKNPVVSILFSCDAWENKLQECNCMEDFVKKHKKSSKRES